MRGARFTNTARGSLHRTGCAGYESLPKPGCRPPLAARASLSPAAGDTGGLISIWTPNSWIDSAGRLTCWPSPSSSPSHAGADSPARCGRTRPAAGGIRPSRAPYAQAEAPQPVEDPRDLSISAGSVCRGIDAACLLKAAHRRGRVLLRGVQRRGSWIGVHACNRARGIKPTVQWIGAPPGATETCRA